MRVIAPNAGQAYRLARVFENPTSIFIQVKHAAAKFFFDFDQSGAQSGGSATATDGMVIMASNTNPAVTPAAQPWKIDVQGEVWYSSDTANADFVYIENHGVLS